jgi:cbb3-type cytochrome oxidase maturation protein
MEVVYITIGVSIIVAIFFFVVFIKSVKSGQYEDTYTPAVRMLFDDELVTEKGKNKQTNKNKLKTNN